MTEVEPTTAMPGVAAFCEGVHNGCHYTAADVDALAANFDRFKAAATPFYQPNVTINHKDDLACGRVTGVRAATLFGRRTLFVDAADVPVTVANWCRNHRLRYPSVEFWPPGTVDDPAGGKVPTPVLKALSLMGGSPPGCKTLLPLSALKFADAAPVVFADSPGVPLMDRPAVIAALQAAGMDVSAITDATPDEVLQAMLACVQKCNANPPPPVVPPVTPTVAPPMKFHDRNGAERVGTLADYQAEVTAVMNGLRVKTLAADRNVSAQLEAVKAAKIKAFQDEMTGANGRPVGFMTPAQFDAVAPLLARCDAVAVRKFADGKIDGTDLDEEIARLRNAYSVPLRKFKDQLHDPLTGHAGGSAESKLLKGMGAAGTAIAARRAAAAKA